MYIERCHPYNACSFLSRVFWIMSIKDHREVWIKPTRWNKNVELTAYNRFFFIYFTNLLFHWDFFQGKFGSLSLGIYVWGSPLYIKIKRGICLSLFFSSFFSSLPSGWNVPFSGASRWIDIAPSIKNWVGSVKGLMIPSKFWLKGIFFFYFFFS